MIINKKTDFRQQQGNLIFRTMLEFCKEVLTKVSFDMLLFRKELEKAIRRLIGEERTQLKVWCLDNFGTRYGDIIIASFTR